MKIVKAFDTDICQQYPVNHTANCYLGQTGLLSVDIECTFVRFPQDQMQSLAQIEPPLKWRKSFCLSSAPVHCAFLALKQMLLTKCFLIVIIFFTDNLSFYLSTYLCS